MSAATMRGMSVAGAATHALGAPARARRCGQAAHCGRRGTRPVLAFSFRRCVFASCTPAHVLRGACRQRGGGVQGGRRRLTCSALLTLASVLTVCGVESVIELVAFLMGSAMGAGSFVLYSPIVLRLLRTRRASGMSVATWAMQLFAFTAACIYNAAKGHSLSAWGETLVFAVQSAGILLLVLALQGKLRSRAVLLGAAAYAALLGAAVVGLPPAVLNSLQICASVAGTSALLPQLWLNATRRSSGGWSPLTAGLSSAGNAVRVFTTVQLTGDPLMLATYLAGLTVNAILLAQILMYGDGDATAAVI